MSGFIYLASPYTHTDQTIRDLRYLAACRAAAQLMRDGWNVFSPIAHSHPIELTGIGEQMSGDFWKCQDIPLLRHAAKLAVLTLDGWQQSSGIQWEVETAEALHIPIVYLDPDNPTIDEGSFDLIAHLERQREFSLRTFGPGARTLGVTDHITKELEEIKADPNDLMEWVDVILLALDGAWRAGYEPKEIAKGISAKMAKNEARQWPDWRTADPSKAIEHVREVAA